jgi:hypothetical protein
MCGSTEIDGHAFCLGVDSLKRFFETDADLQSLIHSVTYLIRGAIFRPKGLGRASQDVRSLGELIDMYHTREAIQYHDKVYALLGMSSDAKEANLLVDYRVPWEELFQRLVRFLLCEKISIETRCDEEIAVIKSKGCVVGKVRSVRGDTAWNGGQDLKIYFNNTGQSAYRGEESIHWTLQFSAKPIRAGDLICLLQGASKPTIIRLCEDHFAVIIMAATPLENTKARSGDIKRSELSQLVKLFTRDFILIWDWKNSPKKSQDLGKYNTLMQENTCGSAATLESATRLWNVALILEDVGGNWEGGKRLQKAIMGVFRARKHSPPPITLHDT